jgi:mannose-6-phosphate isomerase-like protein (cupin superfamily)
MGFSAQSVKGLTKCLVDADIAPHKLRLHVSEIAPGARAHEAHTHAGIEAFYVLEGHGAVEVEGESNSIGPNESIILDASKLHGLVNIGTVTLRYLVVIAGH